MGTGDFETFYRKTSSCNLKNISSLTKMIATKRTYDISRGIFMPLGLLSCLYLSVMEPRNVTF